MKKIELPCYKVEIAMSIPAWVFLAGTTNGTSNQMYFLSLLQKLEVKKTNKKKRGIEYVVRSGCVDASLLSLEKEWKIGRKAVTRLLRDFERFGLISVAPSRLTTIIKMTCVVCWIGNGRCTSNPCFAGKFLAYEGVRVYLFDGQELPTVRQNNKREKMQKNDDKSDACAPEDTTNEPT